MLENWLHPIEPTSILAKKTIQDYALFHAIDIHTYEYLPSLKGISLAIIGLDESANSIRRELYQLSWHFNDLKCADLGNIRNTGDDSITQVLTELIDGGILPIIIGGEDIRPIPQFLAHKGLRKLSNVAIVDEKVSIPTKENNSYSFVNELIQKYHKAIFNLSFLAYQSYYCAPNLNQWLIDNKFDGIRLGKIKSEIEEAEPIIRDADMFLFQLDSLQQNECPAVNNPSPNGLLALEACQLCRYAGMNDKLGSFSISGYYPPNEIAHQSVQVIAQMIWYFIEGFYHRKNDFPSSNIDMTEYVVDYKHLNYQLTFWKSQKSGRWWMQMPVSNNEALQRHQLIPCSYKDYKQSCSGELPERLMLALDRLE